MRDDGYWRPYSNGSGVRHWFVARATAEGTREELDTADGRLRWFGSSDTAGRAAAKANAAGSAS